MQIFVCGNCKNYIGEGICTAFPNGIPNEILTGENDHKTPLPEQDDDIVFEEKED